jgi:hypothetical protein
LDIKDTHREHVMDTLPTPLTAQAFKPSIFIVPAKSRSVSDCGVWQNKKWRCE